MTHDEFAHARRLIQQARAQVTTKYAFRKLRGAWWAIVEIAIREGDGDQHARRCQFQRQAREARWRRKLAARSEAR